VLATSASSEHHHHDRRRTQEFLTLQFSLWHPRFTAEDAISSKTVLFVDPVLQAIQDFLCEETELVLIQNSQNNVCMRTLEEGQSMIAQDRSSLLLADGEEQGIRWTSWTLTYQVLQVGDDLFDQANNNQMLGTQVMENVAQLALDVSIMEGTMDQRLEDFGAFMCPVGQEVEAFQEIVEEEEGGEVEDPLVAVTHPRLLRWIGIIMLITDLVGSTLLGYLGRRRRVEREGKGETLKKREEMGGLVTEAGVDHMLEVGRREVISAVSAEFRSIELCA
jgi:hypothetical protein